MVTSQDNNNMCGSLELGDVCFMEECPAKEWMDFDELESDEGCEDVVDLLPNDPFGMEFNKCLPNDLFGVDFDISLPRDPFSMEFDVEATVAAFSGWMEEFGLKAFDEASGDKNTNDSRFFAELNFVWASSIKYGHKDEDVDVAVDTSSSMHSDDGSNAGQDVLGDYADKLMCFGSEKYESEHLKYYNDGDGGAPADALFFALSYLGVRDLISVERVCKSLCGAVQNDPLLWRNILIDYPLCDKITDDDLLRLTDRAQGTLCSLNLVRCLKITNDGLKRVLEKNPGLTKLSVPGCIKLRVEGMLHDLKVFNLVARPGIKCLRISELGLTTQHFKEFKLLLGAGEDGKVSNFKPRYYRAGQIYLSLDDDCDIDIEICPMCQQARQVYDCPAQSCQVKKHSAEACRACIICIARCISCGCCVKNKVYEETFSFELLCFDCWAHAYFHQRANYQFLLYS